MGYMTVYQHTSNDGEDHSLGISNAAGYSNAFGEGIKWYRHDDTMSSYSREYVVQERDNRRGMGV